MPQRDTSGIGNRVPSEIIDADFEVAFSLIKLAKSESKPELAVELRRKASGMLEDLQGRMRKLTAVQREVYEKRIEELSRQLES